MTRVKMTAAQLAEIKRRLVEAGGLDDDASDDGYSDDAVEHPTLAAPAMSEDEFQCLLRPCGLDRPPGLKPH